MCGRCASSVGGTRTRRTSTKPRRVPFVSGRPAAWGVGGTVRPIHSRPMRGISIASTVGLYPERLEDWMPKRAASPCVIVVGPEVVGIFDSKEDAEEWAEAYIDDSANYRGYLQ